MSKLLIPVNGTHNCELAARRVVREFMNDTSIEVHVLNVQVPLTSYVTRFLSRKSVQDFHRDEAEKALAPIRQLFDSFGVPHAVHMRVGERAECITAMAHELQCDHIVMGSARQNSLTRLVEDSTTNRVLELTDVPVEVVSGDAVSRWERYGIPAGIGTLIAMVVAAIAD